MAAIVKEINTVVYRTSQKHASMTILLKKAKKICTRNS